MNKMGWGERSSKKKKSGQGQVRGLVCMFRSLNSVLYLLVGEGVSVEEF